MKKVLLGLAALTVLLIVAVIVAPSFIDWTNYRNGIAAEIERVLNRRVVIAGAVEAAIVPTPRLSLRDARLGNLPGASSPTMAEVEALEVRVAFWPLLTGRVVVTSVVLRKPVIELEVLADGRPNWLFTGPAAATRPRANPAEGLPDGVQFENAVVTDGTIIYRDARSGAEERVEGVNARLAAEGLYGPLRAAGELRYGALPLRFGLAMGRLDPRGRTSTPINFSAEIRAERRGQPARGSGNFTGTFRLADVGPQFNGQLKLNGADLTNFVADLGAGEDAPFVLAQSFSLEGAVELKDDVLNGNDLMFQLGETRAQGALSASFTGDQPQLDLALSVGRIDLDAWLAAAAKKREEPKRDADAAREPEEFILPVGFRMTVDVAADALTYRGGAMRQMKLAAEMADGLVDIHQLSLQLPGGTDGLFNGKLLAVDGRPRLDGFAELTSDDFRSLLAWLDLDASDLPAGRLNKVSAASHVAVTSEMLELGDLDLRFDSSRITGALVAALRDRPALGINFAVDQLDLDLYMPGGAQPPAAASALAASQIAAAAIPLRALAEFDANVRLRVGQLVAGSTAARGVNLDGTLLNGVLTMRKLAVGNLAGGAASLSGTLEGFDDRVRMNLQFDVEANEPMTLLRAAGVALPIPEAALTPLSASGRLSGSSARYKINGVVNAAVMSLAVVGDVAHPPEGPARYALDLSLDHPNYVGFLRLFDPSFAPEQPARSQVVSLNTKLEGNGQSYKLSAIGGVFGPLTLEGNAALAFDGGLPRVDAQLSAGDIDTRHFLAAPEKSRAAARAKGAAPGERWSTTPVEIDLARFVSGSFNLGGKSLRHGGWSIEQPTSEFTLGGGGIEVKRLSGEMMGGKLAAQGRLVPTGRPDAAMSLAYTVSLKGASLASSLFEGANIDVSSGRFDLSLEGGASGTSEAALIAGIAGTGSVAFENAMVKGFDLARLNSRMAGVQSPGELVRLIQSSLSSGSTKVDQLRGDLSITDGVVGVDNLTIRSPAGEIRALVVADLPQWRLDATAEVRLADSGNGPSIEVQLSGPLDAPKRDIDSNALQAFMLEESVRRPPSRSAPASQSAPTERRLAPRPASPGPASPSPAPPGPAPPGPAPTSEAPPQNAPRTLSVSPNAPGMAPPRQGSPASTPDAPREGAPRVLSVSPNAPGAPPSANAPRVLNVSPNAVAPINPGQVPAPGSGLSDSPPRILSISPNAAPAATPGPQSAPAPVKEPAPPSAGDPPPAQPANPDSDSFARDILRDLGVSQ